MCRSGCSCERSCSAALRREDPMALKRERNSKVTGQLAAGKGYPSRATHSISASSAGVPFAACGCVTIAATA